jgi:hypothetical protein
MSVRFIYSDGNQLVGRDSFVVAFFSLGDYKKIVDVVPNLFERWFSQIPKNSQPFALIGANATTFKLLDATELYRLRNYISSAKATQRKKIFLVVSCGEDIHCPDYRFTVAGTGKVDNPLENTLVEMNFPMTFFQEQNPDAIVNLVRNMASQIPYDSAYASPGLIHGWEDAILMEYAGLKLYPYSMRHPGYDIAENAITRLSLGMRTRGARWLTLLGPGLVEQLGGKDLLSQQITLPISLMDAGDGVLIQAGDYPEIGDVNRARGPILLPMVARLVESVTYFGDYAPLSALISPDKDEDEMIERWEKRLFKE